MTSWQGTGDGRTTLGSFRIGVTGVHPIRGSARLPVLRTSSVARSVGEKTILRGVSVGVMEREAGDDDHVFLTQRVSCTYVQDGSTPPERSGMLIGTSLEAFVLLACC